MSCSTNNLDFSYVPPTQEVVAGTQWCQYPCLTRLGGSTSLLEFRIDRANTFVDLGQIYLKITVNVTKSDGSDLPAGEIISIVNNFGYSMFSDVELHIQDQKVTQNQGSYGWLSYVRMLTGCTSQELKYFLSQAVWVKDHAGLFDKITFDQAKRNEAFKTRAAMIAKSKKLTMFFKVMFDFSTDRLLPDQLELLLRFRQCDPSLCLLASSSDYKVNVHDASLYVSKSKLSDGGVKLIDTYMRSGLRYPSTRYSTRAKVISQNDQVCEWVPFTGTLPKRIYLFQVCQAAFNADISKNMFNFQNFGLKQIQIFCNDRSIPLPSGISVQNWKNASLLYMTSILALNDPSRVNFSAFEFGSGYGVMCFDLTSDLSASTNQYTDKVQNGTLRIKIDYKEPLEEAVILFCLAEHDATLVIDADRNPHWE